MPEVALELVVVRVAPSLDGLGALALDVSEEEVTVLEAAEAEAVESVGEGDEEIPNAGLVRGEAEDGDSVERPIEGGAATVLGGAGEGEGAGLSGLSQFEKKSSSAAAVAAG